jgi:hypothetical protein
MDPPELDIGRRELVGAAAGGLAALGAVSQASALAGVHDLDVLQDPVTE